MRVCALTMVYRDYWALAQWHRHYAAMLDAGNLFVIAHGPDPKIAELCPGANVITLPRDEEFRGFDRWRSGVLNDLQRTLLRSYDWVLRTDADELICIDPGQWNSLPAMLASQEAPALFALGLNVLDLDGEDPVPQDGPALRHRRNAVFSGHYSKAFAVREPLPLLRHGVRLKPGKLSKFPFAMPEGTFLSHLKFANRAALTEANGHRVAIAGENGSGRPGAAWRNAEIEAERVLREAMEMPFIGWPRAARKARGKVARPVRDAENGLLKARSWRFGFRTRLPRWFGKG